jgi:hypothetical protein
VKTLKYRLAAAELKIRVPCSECGRDIMVPAPSIKPAAHGARCDCGAGYHIHIPALAIPARDKGAEYHIVLLPSARKGKL